MTGTIKMNSNTAGHLARLEKHGYKFEVCEDGKLHVQISGWADKEPTNIEELMELAKAHKAVPYLRGLQTVWAMDRIAKGASCLVMENPEKKVKKDDRVQF